MPRLLVSGDVKPESEDMLVTLHRILKVGLRLADTAGLYAWGLDTEFAVLRAAGAVRTLAPQAGFGEEISRDRRA